MLRLFTLLLALPLVSGALAAQTPETGDPPLSVTNRERTLRFSLLFDGESVAYRVDRLTPDGAANVVIDRSPLGITRGGQDFRRGFELVGASAVTEQSGVYRMVSGKQLDVRTRARQRVFTFRKGTSGLMTITVRAMRDGVAFRYGFPGPAGTQDSLTGEATGFHLPPGRAWMQPYQRVATWAPAYESDYRNGIPTGTTAPETVGWALPMLFHTSDSWVLVTEAGLDRTSYGVHVEQRAEGGLYRVRLPEEEETYGVAPQAAAITLPWTSPWRVLIIGSTLGTIVESTMVTDLAQPQVFGDVSWIRPGRVSWSWWSDMTSPRDYQKVFPFVDLASRLHWEYSLLDAGWQQMSNGGDATELVEYAKARGVGLIAWYNSGGAHNQAQDGPRDLMVDPETRRAEMKRIAALGFRGIKVDFMLSDKQYVIGLYQDILRDAYANRLFVDFHGATIPRGWQRTYPNLLSMEAVRGSEQYGDSVFQRNAAIYNTIYPFTRNVIGSMDYTPMIFGDAPDRLPHLTTNPHELALSVVFESGLQHFVSTPAMIDAQPDYVKEFLTAVPTAWDETRFVDGYPGQLAVLARRRGADWYVGADDDRRHRPVARDDRPEPAAYHDTSRPPSPRERPALDPGIAEVNQRLDNLTRQLDQLARLNVANAKASASRQDEAPRHLTDAISKLDRRLDQLVAEGRSATSEIERRMSAVDRVVADLGQQKPRPAVVAPPTPLDQALMEIADRQRALDGHPPAPAVRAPTAAQAPAAVQTPAAVPAPTPSEALPRARTQEFSGLERELRQINTQIQALSRPCNIDSAVGKAVDTLRDDLAEIGVMLQDALPRKAVEALEGQVRKLSERIDNTRDAGVDGGAVAGVERGLMEVRDALRGLTPAESLVGVDQAVKELSRKIDMIGGGSQDPAALKQLESAIVAMRGIVSHVASNDALARLSDEVRSLADKVEHVGSGGGSDVLSSLERRIGSLADALEARNRHGQDVPRDIDDVVKGLIDKIDRLQISRGDHAAFGHLDERIALLVEKLDASDARLNHLEALERGLAELLIHLEHQRLPHLAGAAANPPPEVDALNRDVADLKEIEKKTQDSLEAFHGTLGHVVERLAMIETDMRGMTTQERAAPAAPAAPLAPRLAPAVAPAELPIAPPSPPPRLPEVETAAAAPEEEDFAALDEEVAAAPHHAAANPVPAPANERRPIDPNLPPDHPLEPGVARLRHPASPADRIAASEAALGPAKPPVIPDPGGGKPNFIAAARRAAQAAAGEAPARARPAEQPAGDSKAGKIASLLRRHARSLIVGLSVMAIVLGTLHMAATWLRSSEEPEMEAPSRPEKSTPPTAAVPSPAPPDEAPAAAAPEKPPSGRQSALAPALDPAPAAPPASGMLLAIETARQAMNTPALKAANAAPVPTAPAHPAPAPVARAADVPAPAAPAPPAAPALVLLPPPAPPALAIPAPAPLPPAVTAQAAAAQPAATTPATGTDRLPATIGGALRAAAAKGEAAAEFEIASRYAEGRGMAQNFTEAAHWFERAAKQGLAPAQFRLAGLHEKGVGVRKDLDAARRLYLAAGEAGHAKALHNLAVLYAEGIDGKPDYLSAAKWFRKAADYGIADSQYNLGILCARGIGVEQNLTEAYRWLALAAREGDSEAAKKRDDVGARLDERSLTAARAVLQTWTPEPQPEAATQVKTPAGGWDTAAAVPAPAPKRKPPAAGAKFDLSIPRPAQ